MHVIQGDLVALALDGHFDVIIHGCNCQCQMGKGIALTIKQRFPEAYAADLRTVKGDASKLGTFSSATIQRATSTFTVVNAYTQFHWRGEGVKADYGAIRQAMRAVKSNFSGQRIGYPRIGAGLAGGDWDVIAALIDEELDGQDHTLVEFTPR
ncbi:macro domain-containing protein [Labrys neptuniae]|uniref:Macro domain-containing protein n=1 Tax=Labrys neptuniae TaxID=376174 RepID=A0ABV3PG46_9HYPH